MDKKTLVIGVIGGVIGGVLAHFFPNPNGRFAFTPAPGDGYTVEFCGEKPVAVYKLSERQSRT